MISGAGPEVGACTNGPVEPPRVLPGDPCLPLAFFLCRGGHYCVGIQEGSEILADL